MNKLYFYNLINPFNKEPYLICEEHEAKETSKQYKAITVFPNAYKNISKDDIGRISGISHNFVILTEKDDDLAKSIFTNYYNTEIETYKKKMDKIREILKAIEKF